MAENEVPTKIEGAAPAEVAPPTRDELVAKLEQFSERARAAGLSPLRMMTRSYAERGMKMLDGLLSGLEALEEDTPKKPPAEDVPAKKKD